MKNLAFLTILLVFTIIFSSGCADEMSGRVLEENAVEDNHLLAVIPVKSDDLGTSADENLLIKSLDIDYFPAITNYSYVDDLGFEILMDIYSQIDFIVPFAEFDKDTLDIYLRNFHRLLTGETVIHADEDKLYIGESEERYIQDFLHDFQDNHPSELPYKYLLLNYSGESFPLLGVTSSGRVMIFKYSLDEDRFDLWYRAESSYEYFIAPNRMSHGGGRNPLEQFFVLVDENSTKKMAIHFYSLGIPLDDNEWDSMNLVSLPFSQDVPYIPEQLENQAITFEGNPFMFFRVTLEQFNILRKDYEYLRNNLPVAIDFHELFVK